MKLGKTAKTILIAGMGLLGSAAIIAGTSFILGKLVTRASLQEGDTSVTESVSSAMHTGELTSFTAVTVDSSTGNTTVLNLIPNGDGTLLTETVTDPAGNSMATKTKRLDTSAWEQLSLVISSYRLIQYATASSSAVENTSRLQFSYGEKEYCLLLPPADSKAEEGVNAVSEVLGFYLNPAAE